eukprot:365584-Chlamydomonas_euryale.AAC.20
MSAYRRHNICRKQAPHLRRLLWPALPYKSTGPCLTRRQAVRVLRSTCVQVEASVEDFDAAMAAAPSMRPFLWQRGLSLYYGEGWRGRLPPSLSLCSASECAARPPSEEGATLASAGKDVHE